MPARNLAAYLCLISTDFRAGWTAADRMMEWNAVSISSEGREKELAKLKALYTTLKNVHEQSPFASPDMAYELAVLIAADLFHDQIIPRDNDDLLVLVGASAQTLLLQEIFFDFADIDWNVPLSLDDSVALRNYLERKRHFLLYAEHILDVWSARFADMWTPFLARMPKSVFAKPDGGATISLSVPLVQTMDSIPETIEHVMAALAHDDVHQHALFEELRSTLVDNLWTVTGVPPEKRETTIREPVTPKNCREPAQKLPDLYLRGTPFLNAFQLTASIDVPDRARFAHHWMVAGSGHGKTQTLQYLIAQDLKKVANGKASLIILDSQGDLIKTVSGLKLFADGQPLAGKLIHIDPNDVDYPVALNLFDLAPHKLDKHDPADRERLYRSALDIANFVICALLDSPMTSRQASLFNYVLSLLFAIPNATLRTFRDILEAKDFAPFEPYLKHLPPDTQHFFLSDQFVKDRFLQDTKQQVLARISGIFSQSLFANMLTSPRSKIDLFAELNAGKVILIDADKSLLNADGTKLFGRFFIGLVAQVAAQRATLKMEARLPTFFYVDECHDYFAHDDERIPTILEQARKQSIGVVLAHQYVEQIPSPRLLQALAANTAIKMVGGVSERDANLFARAMRASPEFLSGQPPMSFATFVRGMTEATIPFAAPKLHLERFPRMSAQEREDVRAAFRARYATPRSSLEASARSQSAQSVHEEPEAYGDRY